MKLDETNKAIIKELSNGRKAFSTIAEKIGITENTVRSRVNKLLEDGVLQISGLVDPQSIPEMQVVIMGIKLSTLDLELKAKEMLSLKGVISVVVVTGRYDLIVQLVTSTQDDQSLLNFFKNELSKIKGISDVETFVVYQAHNFMIPFIL
ncbi:MAG: Lrp/AsnC family transcriptional regulator [Spirochaetales bacterium]|nr:Lrp/AsnC family transcriptional regulator [Spirochaetales bacterium]MBO6048274.1 Lrp/AsnC family transcriptional regulator [Spirochaetales bacterium]MBP5756306.1 Lrp/AsnC family transcriptional regulator [Spirochaetales bacterium]